MLFESSWSHPEVMKNLSQNTKRWKLSDLHNFPPKGQTDIATSWAPVGAKKRKVLCHCLYSVHWSKTVYNKSVLFCIIISAKTQLYKSWCLVCPSVISQRFANFIMGDVLYTTPFLHPVSKRWWIYLNDYRTQLHSQMSASWTSWWDHNPLFSRGGGFEVGPWHKKNHSLKIIFK